MSSLAKPSHVAFRVVASNERPQTGRARVSYAARLAGSLDALEQLRTRFTAAARRRLGEWRHRIESRNELRLHANQIVSDTGCSRYDVELELRKPFWRP